MVGSSIRIEDLKRAEHQLHALKEQPYKESVALRDEIYQTSMFEEIVGASAPLQQLLALVGKVAATESTVLITGETGRAPRPRKMPGRATHARQPGRGSPRVPRRCTCACAIT